MFYLELIIYQLIQARSGIYLNRTQYSTNCFNIRIENPALEYFFMYIFEYTRYICPYILA